jgi:hypothetical protein
MYFLSPSRSAQPSMRLQLVLLAHAACAAALTVSEVPRAHRPKAAPHLAVRMAASSGTTTIEVTVRRSADGGLGIQVDETNTVASCPGQPELAIGDRIVALNGEELGGRYLAEVLPQADQYTFAIQRDSADAGSMERRLQRLTEQVSADTLLELSKDEVLTGKIVLLAEALEAEAEPQPEAAVAEALRGFWRLAFTNGTVAAGLTGYGSLPFCYVSGLFSAFTEKGPPAEKGPSTRSADTDSAHLVFLDHLKAQAAPAHPRAPPEALGGSPWAQGPAPGRPKVEGSSPLHR